MSQNGNNGGNTTSFASILAGVQKLRDSANKIQVENGKSSETSSDRASDNTVRSNDFRKASQVDDISSSLKRNRDETAANLTYRPAGQTSQRPSSIGVYDSTRSNSNREQLTSFTKTSLYQNQYAKNKAKGTVASKIAIHPSQKGNPLIKSLRNIPYEYTSIIKTDYLINSHIAVLFLSLKYHKLRPDYIYDRLKKFGLTSVVGETPVRHKESSHLKILLLLIDSETNYWDSLQELTKLCVFNDFTLLAAWTFEEAGDYIYLLKNVDSAALLKTRGLNDKFDLIKGIHKADYYSRLLETLTSIRSINKTDVSKVASSGNFKNFHDLITDTSGKLELIEGFGAVKLKRFQNTIEEPFIYGKDYDNDPKILEWRKKCKKVKLERDKKPEVQHDSDEDIAEDDGIQ